MRSLARQNCGATGPPPPPKKKKLIKKHFCFVFLLLVVLCEQRAGVGFAPAGAA
jgi:hypothetical protein